MLAPKIIVGTLTFDANLTFPGGIWQLRQIDLQHEHPKNQNASFFWVRCRVFWRVQWPSLDPSEYTTTDTKTMLFYSLVVILDGKKWTFLATAIFPREKWCLHQKLSSGRWLLVRTSLYPREYGSCGKLTSIMNPPKYQKCRFYVRCRVFWGVRWPSLRPPEYTTADAKNDTFDILGSHFGD